MFRDVNRLNYELIDEYGNRVLICSKYKFNYSEIELFVEEAREAMCCDLISITNYLIENHEFEKFKTEVVCEV